MNRGGPAALLTILSAAVAYPMTVAGPATVELSEDLRVDPIVPGVYRHVSYRDMPEFGRVPANGLIVVGDSEAALVDTPWTDEQTALLFEWTERKLGVKIAHVVATHSHGDCMGGLAEAHRRGARSYSSELTAELAAGAGDPVPRTTFAERHRIPLGSVDIELRYFGGGHTRDNIVAWLPRSKVLFGGCLVKRTGGGAGYLTEADLAAWPETIRKVRAAFPDAEVVVAGHGKPGGLEYLSYTAEFVEGLRREE